MLIGAEAGEATQLYALGDPSYPDQANRRESAEHAETPPDVPALAPSAKASSDPSRCQSDDDASHRRDDAVPDGRAKARPQSPRPDYLWYGFIRRPRPVECEPRSRDVWPVADGRGLHTEKMQEAGVRGRTHRNNTDAVSRS